MNVIKRVMGYLRPYRGQLGLAFVALVLLSVAELLIPLQIQRVIDDGIAAENNQVIIRSALIMVGLSLVSMVMSFGTAFYAVRISEYFAADMRDAAYRQIQAFSFSNLDKLRTGELLVRLTSDINAMKMAIVMTIRMAMRAPILLIGAIIILVITSPRLSLLLLILMPSTAGLILWFSRRTEPLYKRVQERLDRVNTILQENIAGVRVVKAFVRGDHEEKRFGKANQEYASQNIEVNMIVAILFPSMLSIMNFGAAGILYFGGNLAVNTGTLTTGEIVAFVNYLSMTVFPILMLGFIMPQIYAAMASGTRVFEVVDTGSELVDRDTAQPVSADGISGRVTFDNVSFDYDGEVEEDAVLHNINFTAEPGETVAILGATGSGKSTLISLIPRLYEATEGQVLIDGVDVRDMTQASLRAHIGFALQEAVLFSGTIRENIRFGRPAATDEEVEAAARAAQAHDFITSKPDGYDSAVEQRGKNFSGGQKQRMAIARALCVRPSILILDDSTSAVDVETETLIQHALNELMADRTTFIVAQRISTVLNADKILVLDRGKITAIGNHRELIKSSPIYQEIFDSQLGDGQSKSQAEVLHA